MPMIKPSGALARSWQEDYGLTALLLLLVLVVFVAAPLQWLGPLGQTVLRIIVSLMIVTGVVAVAR
jgi:hypothetical protein